MRFQSPDPPRIRKATNCEAAPATADPSVEARNNTPAKRNAGTRPNRSAIQPEPTVPATQPNTVELTTQPSMSTPKANCLAIMLMAPDTTAVSIPKRKPPNPTIKLRVQIYHDALNSGVEHSLMETIF